MKFTFDLIVYFQYSIIESILVWEYIILIRPKSDHLSLSKIDVGLLYRWHIVCCNFAVLLRRLVRNFVFVCVGGRYYTFCRPNTWNYNMYNHANVRFRITKGRKRVATCQKKDKSYTHTGISQRGHSKIESILNLYKKFHWIPSLQHWNTALTENRRDRKRSL